MKWLRSECTDLVGSTPRKLQKHCRRRSRMDVRARGQGRSCDMLSPGHDVAIAPLNAQQPWWPAQDPHKVRVEWNLNGENVKTQLADVVGGDGKLGYFHSIEKEAKTFCPVWTGKKWRFTLFFKKIRELINTEPGVSWIYPYLSWQEVNRL